ncbi:MAG: hypothetical protein FWE24_01460 [Defluviitaleaceae bacterium]|nr:hypothetical protein [Defluviitaleaceae bacterium]
MRKFILSAVSVFSIVVLTACNGNTNTAEQVQNTQITLPVSSAELQPTTAGNPLDVGFEIQIALVSDDSLNTFERILELDYSIVRAARDGIDNGLTNGENLVIWANQPLRDFSVLLIGNDFINDEIFFIPVESFAFVSELSPEEAFVINNYFGLGTLPWSGITFIDENDIKRYFTIQQSMYDGSWHLHEFENRTDELPDDWEPWWEQSLTEASAEFILEPSPELRAALLEASGISEYGWQVAAEFLSGFDSLLVGVYREDFRWDENSRTTIPTGSFTRWDNAGWEVITTYEQPEISFIGSQGGGFFDISGNKIEEAPWAYIQRFEEDWRGEPIISYSHHYANYFKLFDFNHNGIPDILIHFNQTFEGCYGGFYRIFRYINGAYRILEMVAYDVNGNELWVIFGTVNELFVDADGRLISFIDSELSDMRYDQLVLTDTHAEFRTIINAVDNWDEWREHHWTEWDHNYSRAIDSWVLHNPTIFMTDIPITPLLPFEGLGTELLAYLKYQRQ